MRLGFELRLRLPWRFATWNTSPSHHSQLSQLSYPTTSASHLSPSRYPPLSPPSPLTTFLSCHPPLLPPSSLTTLLSYHPPLSPPSPLTALPFHHPLLSQIPSLTTLLAHTTLLHHHSPQDLLEPCSSCTLRPFYPRSPLTTFLSYHSSPAQPTSAIPHILSPPPPLSTEAWHTPFLARW